jgi:hypothetical protein
LTVLIPHDRPTCTPSRAHETMPSSSGAEGRREEAEGRGVDFGFGVDGGGDSEVHIRGWFRPSPYLFTTLRYLVSYLWTALAWLVAALAWLALWAGHGRKRARKDDERKRRVEASISASASTGVAIPRFVQLARRAARTKRCRHLPHRIQQRRHHHHPLDPSHRRRLATPSRKGGRATGGRGRGRTTRGSGGSRRRFRLRRRRGWRSPHSATSSRTSGPPSPGSSPPSRGSHSGRASSPVRVCTGSRSVSRGGASRLRSRRVRRGTTRRWRRGFRLAVFTACAKLVRFSSPYLFTTLRYLVSYLWTRRFRLRRRRGWRFRGSHSGVVPTRGR